MIVASGAGSGAGTFDAMTASPPAPLSAPVTALLGPVSSPASPRTVMLAHLHMDLGAALAAGDLGSAQVAHEAIGKLLVAAAQTGNGAPVVDLAHERERHGR